jgi:hypothetical protein
MFPGISVCILSTDPDLVADTVAMYQAYMAEVHVATSFHRIREAAGRRGGP